MFSFKLNDKQMLKNLQKLQRKSPEAFRIAEEEGAIQFLTWCNNGSSKCSRKPPIKTGALRGSSSAFVGGKLVGVYEGGKNQLATRSNQFGDSYDILWVWNANYATRMSETGYEPGPYSKQDGDAGPKWLEQHLKADKENLYEMIAHKVGKGLGMK